MFCNDPQDFGVVCGFSDECDQLRDTEIEDGGKDTEKPNRQRQYKIFFLVYSLNDKHE